jgi:hypothetical protein
LERDDPGNVGLQSQHLQVEHQVRVVRVSGRHANGAIQIRQPVVGRLRLGLLNAALHFAHSIQILVDFGAIARAELLLKPRDAEAIEQTRVFRNRRALRRCRRLKQAFKTTRG